MRTLVPNCLGVTVLAGLFTGLVTPPAVAQWQTECAGAPTAPVFGREAPIVPWPGLWKLQSPRGDKTFPLEVEQCGRRLVPGGAGVLLEIGLRFVPLDRAPTGDYLATETYTEDGGSVTVSWKITPSSPKKMSGLMTVLGIPFSLQFHYLEGSPYQQVMSCECDDIRRKKAEYEQLRSLFTGAGQGGGTGEQVNEEVDATIDDQGGEAATEWATNVATCSVRQGDLDTEYSTQQTFETAGRSGWEHELVHRDRCCAMNQAREQWDAAHPELQRLEGSRMIAGLSAEEEALYQQLLAERPSTYAEWSEDGANDALDETEGYDAGIASLDRWLQEHCQGR